MDTLKQCLFDPPELVGASLLQLDPEDLVVVFEAGLAARRAEVGSEEAFEEATDPISEADGGASDTKAEAVSVGEVGMALALQMGTVMVQHRLLTLLLVLEEEAASVVVTAVLLSTAA